MKSKLIEYLSHKDENLLKKRKVGEAILSNFEHFLGRSKKAGRPTNEFATVKRVILAVALSGNSKEIDDKYRQAVANTLGVSVRDVRNFLEEIIPKINDGKASLAQLRGELRADDMSELADKLVNEFWLLHSKPSSRMGDQVTNPRNRSQKHDKYLSNHALDEGFELFKIWVKQPDGGAQEEVPFGKEVFRRSRPYWVKNEERSVCLCIYHLRMSGYVQVKEILSRNFRYLIKIISKFI